MLAIARLAGYMHACMVVDANALLYISYAESATLVCPATRPVCIIHKDLTIILRLIHITSLVDGCGIRIAVSEQDIDKCITYRVMQYIIIAIITACIYIYI